MCVYVLVERQDSHLICDHEKKCLHVIWYRNTIQSVGLRICQIIIRYVVLQNHRFWYDIASKFIAFGQCNVLLKHYTRTQIASYEIIEQKGVCGSVIVLFRKYPQEGPCETTVSGTVSREHLFKWEKFLMAIYGLKTSSSFCPTV